MAFLVAVSNKIQSPTFITAFDCEHLERNFERIFLSMMRPYLTRTSKYANMRASAAQKRMIPKSD
jgi:hypothetical protein